MIDEKMNDWDLEMVKKEGGGRRLIELKKQWKEINKKRYV
jgi:hypothetical protein